MKLQKTEKISIASLYRQQILTKQKAVINWLTKLKNFIKSHCYENEEKSSYSQGINMDI